MGASGGKPAVESPHAREPKGDDAQPCAVTSAANDASLDAAVDSLRRCGVACLTLDDAASSTHARCFDVARRALDACATAPADDPLRVRADADTAHVTGMHPAGALSSYNACREGFVFSDGAMFSVPPAREDAAEAAAFEDAMKALFDVALGVATATLRAMERRMEIPDGWFEDAFGPLASNAQWHVKRYRPKASPPHAVSVAGASRASSASSADKTVLLPVHTDPSLVSVVVHDAAGVVAGAKGLEHLSSGDSGIWTEVPLHGHGVACVLVGSVMDRITSGAYPAARHRVAVVDPEALGLGRVVATFFWRPAPGATLRPPPSPVIPSCAKFKTMKFGTWCKRTAKRYETHAEPKPRDRKKGKGESGGEGRRRRERKRASDPPAISRRADAADDRLALIGGPLLGREKYLGGLLGDDARIYAIPGFARRVLRIDPSDGAVEYVGPEYPGEFKWLRAVKDPKTGALYGLPCHADAVLKIVPGDAPTITTIGEGKCGTGPWKFHGGVYSPHDGCIYCIPQFAERVLKIDPSTDECTLIGGPFPGRNKWYGGLMGLDGRIYGVPQNHRSVLRIDPMNGGACELFGEYPDGGWKWHGGAVGHEGNIYGIPAHADTVLKIVPGDVPELTEIGANLRTGKHRSDGKYKYLGGVLGRDRRLYFIPSDADHVLQIDTETDVVREIGGSLEGERIVQNKWQNGFVSGDGVIWGIPLKSETVLTVRTFSDRAAEPIVETVGGPFGGLNKWEGGVMSADGRMYCMPLNHKEVLEIDPGELGRMGAGDGGGGGSTAAAKTAGQTHD